MRVANAWLLRAATICSTDGRNLSLLTPGFPLSYSGQWLRDSYYGISSGIDLLPNLTATVAAVEWVFEHARPVDGAMPQSLDLGGKSDANSYIFLDSGPFAIKLAAALISAMTAEEGKAFFLKWQTALSRGLNATTLNPNGQGLPWIDPARPAPSRGYGFQDGEYLSGDVLYSSILFWNATRILADLYDDAGQGYAPKAAALRAQAKHVRAQITAELWSEERGAFVAATQLEHDRISVWGNAFAAASGLATSAQSAAIFELFKTREKDIFFEGQVRQTPAPHFWDSSASVPGNGMSTDGPNYVSAAAPCASSLEASKDAAA